MTTDPIGRMEIEAYIDGELDLPQRLAVEDHLSRHPGLAAQVMADFRNRSALQLLASPDPALPRSLAATAERVRKEGRSLWRRPAAGLAGVAAMALVALAALNMTSSPPSYVDLAVASHRSIKERTGLVAYQPFSDRAQALLSASRIAIPRLPPDWRVIDVEMLRGTRVPALLIAVQTAEGRTLSILALRERSSAPRDPDTVQDGSQSVAYWRKGDFSYALTGEGNPGQIDATADALADSWRT
ncbi:anti-sigma factor RsiW [Sphingobium jiangsuense]|uniref:Anti-sigma factor RsiW n=2 Tax=Sphingobium jiangsuense TaxID=870476 RepID=A0A7W6BL68_9SPHN|nr:anti-sigma factor [Sphingobium jiangsuense]MBB3926991.1 anti-sigma factor RsiW [Sphingobium jiangsuense]